MTFPELSDGLPVGIRSDDGLLVDVGSNTVLGYLCEFPGRGVFSPEGKVEVTADQAALHNRLLSRGEILGLDHSCQIGQPGTFYYRGGSVTTWVGELVSNHVTVSGRVITFRRREKAFRGRLKQNADCFLFRRIV